MTTQAIDAFRKQVSSDQGLRNEFASAYAAGASALAALGRRHGFEFSEAEAAAAMKDGELSEAQLDLVSGGGPKIQY